jgi:hypothetical protein
MIILIIGEIGRIYNTNLLDPIDSPVDIIKSSLRLIEIIHKYFQVF